MTKVSKIIGIDISKEKFDVCFSFQPCGYSSKTYTYNDGGISCFLNEVPADCMYYGGNRNLPFAISLCYEQARSICFDSQSFICKELLSCGNVPHKGFREWWGDD